MDTVVETATNEAIELVGCPHSYRFGENQHVPLILFVHGRAGDHTVMWAFRRHFPQDCTIISIQAPIKDPIGGNSWWLIDNQKPLKNNAQKAAKILDTYITKLLEYYALAPSQIFACGFSHYPTVVSANKMLTCNMIATVVVVSSLAWARRLVNQKPAHRQELQTT